MSDGTPSLRRLSIIAPRCFGTFKRNGAGSAQTLSNEKKSKGPLVVRIDVRNRFIHDRLPDRSAHVSSASSKLCKLGPPIFSGDLRPFNRRATPVYNAA